MKALKYQVRIGSDHRVVVDVPPDLAEGPAEVILLVPDAPATDNRELLALLAEFRARPGGRTKEDIDAQVADERASWGD